MIQGGEVIKLTWQYPNAVLNMIKIFYQIRCPAHRAQLLNA